MDLVPGDWSFVIQDQARRLSSHRRPRYVVGCLHKPKASSFFVHEQDISTTTFLHNNGACLELQPLHPQRI